MYKKKRRRAVLILFRRFGTTYRSHLQGTRIQEYSLTLRMGLKGWPTTSVITYHCSLCSNPEECSSQLFHGGGAESNISHIFLWDPLIETRHSDFLVFKYSCQILLLNSQTRSSNSNVLFIPEDCNHDFSSKWHTLDF